MIAKTLWTPGAQVTLRGVGARVYWAYPAIVVEDAASLVALYIPCGVNGRNVDKKPTPQELLSPEKIRIVESRWHRTDVLMLIVPGDAFSTYVMWNSGTQVLDCWYINLQEPIRRTRIGFDTMDHMLDVVVSPDMSTWRWKDDDEFSEAERVGFYSPEKAREIWAEGERAVKLVTSQRRSFYEKWKTWQVQTGWALPQLSPLWENKDL
jgi:hypothetical protein